MASVLKARGRKQAVSAPVRFEVQVVDINNRTFVSDLFWQPLSNSRNYMAEARMLGKKHEWDIVAVRRGTRVQAGFAPKKSAALKGMYSLAASLAAQLGDSWLGAFALNDGRYIVTAVYERMICIGFDTICNAEEAKRLLANAVTLHQFDDDAIYAPPELEFSSHSRDIYQLLTPKTVRKEHRLRQLTFGLTKRELVIAATALVVLGAGIAGYVWHSEKQAEEAARIAAQRRLDEQRRLAELNARARKKIEVKELVHPWASTSGALDYATTCVAAEDQFPLSIAGWPLREISCEGRTATATYARTEGLTIDQFLTEARELYGESVHIIGDDQNTGVVPVKMEPRVAGDEKLKMPDDVMPHFHSYFEGLVIPVTVSEVPVKVEKEPDVPGQPPTPVPVPTWRQYNFNFSDDLPPTYHFGRMKSALAGLEGVRVDKIVETVDASAGSATWKVEGNIYAQK
ncbi:type 4b pilus protein PilO2 [Burkholderia anthina]|uniref:type 4b pilus protein PilO2 n=1 Tax=Burkholderia anthina TaxID=179879 RepID=UPI00158D4EEB